MLCKAESFKCFRGFKTNATICDMNVYNQYKQELLSAMQQKQVNTAAQVKKATLLHFFLLFSVSDSSAGVVEIRHSLHLG